MTYENTTLSQLMEETKKMRENTPADPDACRDDYDNYPDDWDDYDIPEEPSPEEMAAYVLGKLKSVQAQIGSHSVKKKSHEEVL